MAGAVSESLGINAGRIGNPDKFACAACIQFPFKDGPHENHSIGRNSVAAQLVNRADVRRSVRRQTLLPLCGRRTTRASLPERPYPCIGFVRL